MTTRKQIEIHYLPLQSDNYAEEVTAYIVEKWPTAIRFYTNGSKTNNPSSTGCGIFAPQLDIGLSIQLNPLMSIFSAEAYAIFKALELGRTKTENDLVIVSDAKSVLLAIENNTMPADSPYMLSWAKMEAEKVQLQGRKVHFIWVRGHNNVRGNVAADILAKRARNLPVEAKVAIPPMDLLAGYKELMWKMWQQEWDGSKFNRGANYAKIMPRIIKQPWFKHRSFNRSICTNIIRMRFNHGKFPQYLKRFNLTENDTCNCDQVSTADLEHILTTCPKFREERRTWKRDLSAVGKQWRFPEILSTHDQHYLKGITSFVSASGIRL
jgi:ribonuclease HI